jgi:hypothetical protein
VGGNVNVIATRILAQLPDEESRCSYTMQDHVFHVFSTEGLTFIAVAPEVGGGARHPHRMHASRAASRQRLPAVRHAIWRWAGACPDATTPAAMRAGG